MKGNKEIKRINNKDIDFLKTIGRTCHIPTNYKEYEDEAINISENRINTYQNIGWVEKIQHDNKEYYRTTIDGRNFIEELTGIKPYCSNSPLHDSALLDNYLNLSNDERDSWRTENELREEYFDYISELRSIGDYMLANELEEAYNNNEVSMPDCAYCSDITNTYIAVEIITNNYTQEMIQAKETYCEVMDIECNMERIY